MMVENKDLSENFKRKAFKKIVSELKNTNVSRSRLRKNLNDKYVLVWGQQVR